MILPTLSDQSAVRPDLLPKIEVTGLYVHIPFCFHKCHYCDFYSITRQSSERMTRFVDLLLAEASLWATGTGPTVRPITVFFGGGTPTLLPIEQMQRLIRGLRERFDFGRVAEFTCEANPATVSIEYCTMLRGCGVDRLSFGAQSFDRHELHTLERHHDPDDVPRSIETARAAGFGRLNVDLIYAIPGQNLESWSASLEQALALRTEHLSCYGLTYEPNTPIAVRKRLGQLVAAGDSLELAMLHHTRSRLGEVGLPSYEISNYATPGNECRHNLMYWTGGSYAGFGPSAASHVEGHRFRNRPHLREWEGAVAVGQLPAIDYERLSSRQRGGELVMLMLRLSRGVRFDEFAGRTGSDARDVFADQLDQLSRRGLIEITPDSFRLTESGIDVADAIASEFL
jgi:oxygen-independent coproporphyrinogen III oxidase